MAKPIKSWGGIERNISSMISPSWDSEITTPNKKFFPLGYGRSYGDSALPCEESKALSSNNLKTVFSFDTQNGVIECGSGVSIGELIDIVLPQGYFPPVTPGTKHVSIAGAIANDIHGKNHHCAGTFGCFVEEITLLRSDSGLITCTLHDKSELFRATIGGLGLTGFITKAKFRLKKVSGGYIDNETIKYNSLNEYFSLASESKKQFEYTVAWMDVNSKSAKDLSGLYIRGNHSEQKGVPTSGLKLNVPLNLPRFTLNKITVGAFNFLYRNKQLSKCKKNTISYDPFFYPLDGVSNWNRIYGSDGFFQFQCVIPNEKEAVSSVLEIVLKSGKASFLTVLKDFGNIISPGMLSFPKEGVTLCFDFKNEGRSSISLLKNLEEETLSLGGRMYPAKDALMSSGSFQKFYPEWKSFSEYIDPMIDSSFWNRVTT